MRAPYSVILPPLAGLLVVASSSPLPTTMRGYVATAPNCATQGFTPHAAVPKLGDLRAKFANLPGGACEALLRVAASSINPSDVHPTVATAAGLPHVMGSDVAGTVVALQPPPPAPPQYVYTINNDSNSHSHSNSTGNGSRSRTSRTSSSSGGGSSSSSSSSSVVRACRLQVGDRVWGDIGANTITRIPPHTKTKELGAFGEYAVALDTQLGVMPRNMGFAEAASLPKVALTSWKALTWYAGALNASFAGCTVLVLGGSGGTGSTGIQLARALGAGTILTTTSAANAAYVKQLGANRTIDYHTANWWDPAVVRPDSVDVVYDCVGQDGTGDRAMSVLRSGGHYVTITGQLARTVKAGVDQHMFINSDTNLDSGKLLDALRDMAERDALRMRRIQAVFALSEVAQAFQVSEGGHVVGKLVVNVTDAADAQRVN